MSIRNMQQALLTNENTHVKGAIEVYPSPYNRHPGTLDAHWGDDPVPTSEGYPDVHGTGVQREANSDRADMLSRLFGTLGASSAAEKKLISRQFAHADESEAHSPLLQNKTAAAQVPLVQSLAEQVRRIVGLV